MSLFEDPSYQWRETYFVLFEQERRPTASQVEEALTHVKDTFELVKLSADDEGKFESVTVIAHADFAALDISYLDGEEVLEEIDVLAKDLKQSGTEAAKIARLAKCNARFDIMHFEEVVMGDDEDEEIEMFDPTALLLVRKALAKLTHGIEIDPQSGSLM